MIIYTDSKLQGMLLGTIAPPDHTLDKSLNDLLTALQLE